MRCGLSTRERMVQAACELMEAQGYHATGLNEILQRSDTPRGSLYYHFPAGKEELAAEAVTCQGRFIEKCIREDLAVADDAATAVQGMFTRMANFAATAKCRGGGPIIGVALESSTTNERLRQACAQVYESWRVAYVEKLLACGYAPEQAHALAYTILGAMEGAIVLTRTLRSAEPLLQTGAQMYHLLKATQPD